MTLYFVYFIREIFYLSLLLGIYSAKNKFSATMLTAFIGFIFSYIAFFIASTYLATEQIFLVANIIIVLCMVMLLICFKDDLLPNLVPKLRLGMFSLLSFGFFIRYFVNIQDFPIFTSGLMDTLTVTNIFFTTLAFIFCISIMFLVRWMLLLINRSYLSFCFSLILTLVLSSLYLADILLFMMKEGIIDTAASTITFVAKSHYYSSLYSYIFFMLVFLLSCFTLPLRKQVVEHEALDVSYRKDRAKRSLINANFSTNLGILSICFGIFLFFDLVASKPLELDHAKNLEPDGNGYFIFDASLAMDGKLHRFAYINDGGKRIRFFIINKFEGQVSPSVVFDACSICGDIGYVKDGSELICVACNVRIFLPSVGKGGGCNPLPLPYEVRDGKVFVKVSDVEAGENYFSEVVTKMVTNPVTGSVFSNSNPKKTYNYKGKMYYFDTDKSYEKFYEDPAKYVGDDLKAFFKTNADKDDYAWQNN